MRNLFLSAKTAAILLLTALMAFSCTRDEGMRGPGKVGAQLQMSVNFTDATRLAELPNPGEMAEEKDGNGLKNIGVYVYYTEDYNANDLSRPYVRNMEFTVENGLLVAVTNSAVETDQYVYIYDNMTVVAFYPYNAEMSEPENHFNVRADEENYPITRDDYSEQYYIPYRAQTTTDPTTAFYTVLNFSPKHTYKLEVVVVAADSSIFPTMADVRLLPAIDPVDGDLTTEAVREAWWDTAVERINDGSGSDIQFYTAYIWTRSENRNEIARGEILLQSDQLILIASQNLYPTEQRVYRYGYNMSTGEIFIPTSSNFVYDTSTLAAVNGGNGNYYQVCDIDVSLNRSNWEPITLNGGRYDGGGHRISNVSITVSDNDDDVGLFGKIQGNSTVANVNLQNVTITSTGDNCYVGGLAGRLNTPMTEEEKAQLIGNLPDGLSEVVREALIQEILASAGNSTANLLSSKVTGITITATGKDPIVGGLVGQAGTKNDAGDAWSRIWDSAVIGGSISVNAGDPAANENAHVGGFVGLNEGYIGRCYTTVDNITADKYFEDENGDPLQASIATGFGTMGLEFLREEGGLIESSYCVLPDINTGTTLFSAGWPSWGTYTGIWPVEVVGWYSDPSSTFWYSNGSSPNVYPILQWERR